ncbi:hypothetical protein D3C80_1866570 [compost metagenome]
MGPVIAQGGGKLVDGHRQHVLGLEPADGLLHCTFGVSQGFGCGVAQLRGIEARKFGKKNAEPAVCSQGCYCFAGLLF